ncbi:hypothetical protein S83_070501, partial [Arachis hypogaea]
GSPRIQDINKSKAHLTSAAAFVEGGIQDACDDACSICLEAFCDSDSSTVTNCMHEFHFMCILEWYCSLVFSVNCLVLFVVPFLRFGKFICGGPHFALTSDALKKVHTGRASHEVLLSIAHAV